MSWKDQQSKLKKFRLAEINQTVCIDDDVAQALADAQIRYDQARDNALHKLAQTVTDVRTTKAAIEEAVDADEHVVEAKAKLDDARAEFKKVCVDFTFRALIDTQYDELLSQHAGAENENWNPKTFPPALVAACHVYYEKDDDGVLIRDTDGKLVEGDGMTAEDALELRTTLSKADWDALFSAAYAVNVTPRVDYRALGKG